MNQRIEWIDAAKGWGILLIFVGHIYSTVTPSTAYLFIYAFHVPLFFFISGLTLKPGNEPFFNNVKKKARQLLVPYAFYAALGYIFYATGYFLADRLGIHVAQFDYGLLPPLVGILYGSIGDGNIINGPVWFVMALFWTVLIGYAINSYVRSKALQAALIVGLTALGLAMADQVKPPFSLVPGLIALIFFQAGYLFQQLERFKSLANAPLLALFAASLAITCFSPLNGFAGMGEGILGENIAAFLLFGFSGTFMSVFLVQLIERFTPTLGTALAFLGRYSLSIMLIHMLIIKSVKVVFAGALKMSMHSIDNDLVVGAWVLLASTGLLIAAVYVMERFLPFTLGKTRR